jgi:putative flippase GtrA
MIRRINLDPRMLTYLAGGLLSAFVDIGIMQLLILGGIDVYVATSLGFCGGLLVNYAFHAKVTFKSTTGLQSFSRYLCVVALNYLLTLGCVALSHSQLDSALVGKVLSLPAIAVIGFLLSRHWIYR